MKHMFVTSWCHQHSKPLSENPFMIDTKSFKYLDIILSCIYLPHISRATCCQTSFCVLRFPMMLKEWLCYGLVFIIMPLYQIISVIFRTRLSYGRRYVKSHSLTLL